MIHLVGHCDARLFGLLPGGRLQRQVENGSLTLVARADAVFDDAAIQWLMGNPGTLLADDEGRPLAVAVAPALVSQAAGAIERKGDDFRLETTRRLGDRFVRKLRRSSPMLAFSLDSVPVAAAERLLFASVYKGVTDLVTKWVWPVPAFFVTLVAARLGIRPNFITAIGIALTVLAGWLFYTGQLAGALAAAWVMTFLDTVDGKLARVTVTSSRLGNFLDHGTDIVHPPLWWLCLAQGLAFNRPEAAESIWLACWIVLAAYLVGRAVEMSFHRFFGFNAYLFRPLDSRLRLIVARRNILLLMMTAGLIVGDPVGAFWVCAAWSAISSAIQLLRIGQAAMAARSGKLQPWMA